MIIACLVSFFYFLNPRLQLCWAKINLKKIHDKVYVLIPHDCRPSGPVKFFVEILDYTSVSVRKKIFKNVFHLVLASIYQKSHSVPFPYGLPSDVYDDCLQLVGKTSINPSVKGSQQKLIDFYNIFIKIHSCKAETTIVFFFWTW